jgi:hypothetical protein
MLVELKSGETLNGLLVNCDTWMNLTLKEVVQTSADGDRFWRLPEIYVRGSTVSWSMSSHWAEMLTGGRSSICEYRTRLWTWSRSNRSRTRLQEADTEADVEEITVEIEEDAACVDAAVGVDGEAAAVEARKAFWSQRFPATSFQRPEYLPLCRPSSV